MRYYLLAQSGTKKVAICWHVRVSRSPTNELSGARTENTEDLVRGQRKPSGKGHPDPQRDGF